MDTIAESQERSSLRIKEEPSDAVEMIQLRDISRNKVPCRSLTPDFRAMDVRGIDFKKLRELGVEDFIFDVDNTLAATNDQVINPDFLPFIQEEQAAGNLPRIHLATDSTRDLSAIAEQLGAERVPTPRVMRKQTHTYWNNLLHRIGSPAASIVMIGDSPWWDVRGANSTGMLTVLVEPFSPYAGIEKAVMKPRMDDRARIKINEQYGERAQPPIRKHVMR